MTDDKKYGRQLSQSQAIEFHDSKIWTNWTDEQIVRLQLFQNRLCVPFSRLHEAISKVLGRPVYTHEMAFRDELIKEYLGAKPMPTLDEILELIPEQKRIAIIAAT